MAAAHHDNSSKGAKRGPKTRKTAFSKVVSVRVSDEDKELINRIMRVFQIKSYSDFMRIGLQMVRLQRHSES